MLPSAPHTPAVVVLLVVVTAVAVCMMAAAITVPDLLGRLGAWPVLVGGLVVVVGALSALWGIQKKRDRTLR
jgi:hypothetical protein